MNKLIIIGNGFDLAHGYPTRYTDFILWLAKRELRNLYDSRMQSQQRDNPLFHCSVDTRGPMLADIEVYLDKNVLALIDKACQGTIPDIMFSNPHSRGHRSTNYEPFTMRATGSFPRTLFRNTCENWVDIEQVYYNCLKEILKDGSPDLENHLKELNVQLAYLRDQLREYLLSLKRDTFIPGFQTIINTHINYENLFKPDDWKTLYIDPEELKANSKSYVLNFNYTDTVKQYIAANHTVVVNNIHGDINDLGNPLIFGYGDELDDDFSLMEKQEAKGFLEHVKSLWYLRTRNYHNLIRFIESGYYQIQIIGHSCGRSDRTLLNMVFEHDNCNSVDIFYRKRVNGSDSFNEISEEISRQFRNKQKLRKRVLPKNPTNVIPQYFDIAEIKTA